MQNASTASRDRRSQVHTEVRMPVEVILSRLVAYVFGFIEVIIAMRFVLKLFGASREAGFVQLVYSVSAVLMAPFAAIFGTQEVSGGVFELSALAAIAVYALIAWGIVILIRNLSPRRHAETVERVEKDEDVRVG